jgi:hypothetical protein
MLSGGVKTKRDQRGAGSGFFQTKLANASEEKIPKDLSHEDNMKFRGHSSFANGVVNIANTNQDQNGISRGFKSSHLIDQSGCKLTAAPLYWL